MSLLHYIWLVGMTGGFSGAPDRLGQRLQRRAGSLSPKLLRVARFFEQNRHEVLNRTAVELAAMVGTSDATVVRAAKALGFSGLVELKRVIAASMGEAPSHARNLHRALASVEADREGAIDLVLAHEARLIAQLTQGPMRAALSLAVQCLHEARRVVVFGSGTSGLVAGHAARMMARHGRQVLLLDASGIDLAEQMLSLNGDDALLMIFFGRSYPEAEVVLEEARNRLVPVVMITGAQEGPLAQQADVVIEIRRDGPDGAPLHGAVLTALEAIVMAMAAIEEGRALDTLDRLQTLRERIVRRRASGRQARGLG